MIEAIWIWLYLSLEKVIEAGGILSLILIFIFFLCWVSYIEERDKDKKEQGQTSSIRYIKLSSASLVFFIILDAFYPTKEDLAWIIGGAVAWNGATLALESQGAKQLPENVINAMNYFLESIQEEEPVENN